MAQRLKDWLRQIRESDVKLGPHPDDQELFSSINDVDNLTETQVWKEMVQLAEDRIEILEGALVEAEDYERIRRIQESIKAWRDFKLLPDLMKEFIRRQRNEPE